MRSLPALCLLGAGCLNPEGQSAPTMDPLHGLSAAIAPGGRALARGDAAVSRVAFFLPEYSSHNFEIGPAGDWDGDGSGDLYVLAGGGAHVMRLDDRGEPTTWLSRVATARDVAFFDIDRDGQSEAISASNGWVLGREYADDDWYNYDTWEQWSIRSSTDVGHSISTGDVNGDGYPDALVSDVSTWYSSSGQPLGASAFNVYLGRPNRGDIQIDQRFSRGDADDQFGYWLSSMDVDLDGYDDVLVTQAGCGVIALTEAQALVELPDDVADARWYPGGPSGLSGAEWSFRDLMGPDAGRCDGALSELTPDLDGDGYPDLAVSGHNTVRVLLGGPAGPGDAVVWEGTFTGVCYGDVTYGDSRCPLEGDYVHAVGLGDVNGDGYGELAIARAFGVELYFGGPSGLANGLPYVVDVEEFFVDVDGPGDLDGDGLAEFGVFAPRDEPDPRWPEDPSLYRGSMFLYRGFVVPDIDGDGAPNDLDCDPYDMDVSPFVPEVVGNGIDEDCNGVDGWGLSVTASSGRARTLRASGGPPGTDAVLVGSLKGVGSGPCPPHLGGSCSSLLQPQVVGTVGIDTEGVATWQLNLPGGTGPLWVEAWALTSPGTGSNVVKVR